MSPAMGEGDPVSGRRSWKRRPWLTQRLFDYPGGRASEKEGSVCLQWFAIAVARDPTLGNDRCGWGRLRGLG
jgi:hypothetical protein